MSPSFDLRAFLDERHPDEILLATETTKLNSQQLRDRIVSICEYLDGLGITSGDYCAFQDLKPLDSFLLILACMCRGVIAVPLNPKFRGDHLQPYLAQIPPVKWVREAAWQGDALTATPSAKELNIAIDKPCLIIFTSGSTGPAKGVVHTWSSLAASAQSSIEFYGLQTRWSWLLSLGLFHVGGLLIGLRTLLGRGCLLIPSPEKTLGQAIKELQPEWLSLVPTQLDDFFQDDNLIAILQRCKGIVLGGAAASKNCLECAYSLNLPLSLSYGSSETAAQVTATPIAKQPKNLEQAVAGFPLPGRELQLEVDSQRIKCRGLGLFQGYWMARKFHPHPENGWFLTSDRGQWTDDGLVILGRIDDVFTCGGENLSRSEIQAAISQVIKSLAFLVVKQPDARLGWMPVLYIESDEAPDPNKTMELIATVLPSIKRPRKIYWSTSRHYIFPNQKPAIAQLEESLKQVDEGAELTLLWPLS
ncbi:MAG: AMP-binding protein [Oligoflexus sp.]